jgi:hypothetical protein
VPLDEGLSRMVAALNAQDANAADKPAMAMR